MLIGVAMKTAISLPDAVFTEAEALAKQLGLSRSELYSRALQAFLGKYDRQQMLSQLNEVYAVEPSDLDPELAKMQSASLTHEDW
jgi:metal-responsive CopG/Arc/MetJ family transcriptional regulator